MPGVDVAGGPGEPDGGLAELGADLQRQGRRGRLLDELLMPPLERAVAVPAVDDVAVRVGEDLDLDVAGPVDELLEVDAGVLEGGLGLVAGRLEGDGEVGLVAADPHPLAAAAGGRLDQDGVADRRGRAAGPRRRWRRRRRSRARRRPWPRRRSALASVFRPILRIASWGGPMNSKLQLRQISAKCGVLAQEAVAGVDRLDVGDLGGGDDPGDVQVAVGARALADADGAVGQLRDRGRRGRPASRRRRPRCPVPCRRG